MTADPHTTASPSPAGARQASGRGCVVVVMGVMGSGKTTVGELLATALGWEFHDADAFHSAANVAKMRSGIPLTDDDRKDWLDALRHAIDGWIAAGAGAVLACSALRRTYRDALGVDQDRVRTVYLQGSYDLIRARLEARRHPYMNKALLRSQLETLEEPADGLRYDISLDPHDIVRDVVAALRAAGAAA